MKKPLKNMIITFLSLFVTAYLLTVFVTGTFSPTVLEKGVMLIIFLILAIIICPLVYAVTDLEGD